MAVDGTGVALFVPLMLGFDGLLLLIVLLVVRTSDGELGACEGCCGGWPVAYVNGE